MCALLYLAHSRAYLRKWARVGIYRARSFAHTRIHSCIFAYAHTNMHTSIQSCLHTYVHAYIHTYIPTCMHAYILTNIHANNMSLYVHTYEHTHIHHAHLQMMDKTHHAAASIALYTYVRTYVRIREYKHTPCAPANDG